VSLVDTVLSLSDAFPKRNFVSMLIQNKRRMKRRGRWQPTKRFLPVLVFNWIVGLFFGSERTVDVRNNNITSRQRSER